VPKETDRRRGVGDDATRSKEGSIPGWRPQDPERFFNRGRIKVAPTKKCDSWSEKAGGRRNRKN